MLTADIVFLPGIALHIEYLGIIEHSVRPAKPILEFRAVSRTTTLVNKVETELSPANRLETITGKGKQVLSIRFVL